MKQGSTYGDNQMIEYLLGRMDAEEQAKLEERYLADPELRLELEAVERDLIDQYVRGELANPEQFEKYFLASPRRREKVEFARAFMQSLGRQRIVPERTHASLFGLRRMLLPIAAAVVLVLSAWLFVRNRQEAVPPDPPQARQQTPPGATVPPVVPAPLPRAASIVLTSNLTRNADETPTLVIEDHSQVVLQLLLESVDYKSYSAEIRTVEGVQIASLSKLIPQASNSGPVVTVELPADRFEGGDYTVKLGAAASDGQIDEVGSYFLRVKR